MSITLNTKVYNYVGVVQPGNLTSYSEKSSAYPSGWSALTCGMNGVSPGQTGNYRTSWKLKLPITVAEDSACGCAGEVRGTFTVDVIVTTPRLSTLAERQDVLQRIQDLTETPEFIASVEALQQPFS